MNEEDKKRLKYLYQCLTRAQDDIRSDNLIPFAMKFGEIYEFVYQWQKAINEEKKE